MKYIKFKDIVLPLIGFGTWTIGDKKEDKEKEINAFVYGINKYEMTLIDTAEMYGSGKSEKIVKYVIEKYDREKLFIIDKILPENAVKGKYLECCINSLKRLGTDYIDLYLLHWRSSVDLQTMVNEMEQLVSLGYIRQWGVSNFDVEDMKELFKCKNGNKCFCNQVLYNIGVRGPEHKLIPWCKKHNVLFMAYSPLFNNTNNRENITLRNEFIQIAKREDMTPESLMINFVIRNKDIVTIFKTSNIEHLDNNMKNVFKSVSLKSMKAIKKLFPKPKEKNHPLMKI